MWLKIIWVRFKNRKGDIEVDNVTECCFDIFVDNITTMD